MSLSFKISPKERYFSGNPMVFQIRSDSGRLINYSVKADGNVVFDGTALPFETGGIFEAKIDMAEIFNACFKKYTIIESNAVIETVSDFFIAAQISFGQDNSQIECSFRVYRGGITNSAFIRLKENGYDIFTYRLASYFSQFLFTTRTNGKQIRIKETELFPFVFIHPGVPIVFLSESGTEVTDPAKPAGTVCSMNIGNVLKQMPSGTDLIDVLISGKMTFRFHILPGKLSEEKYLLKFKNSLGAYEILEVTGRAMHAPEFSEETVYEIMNEFDFYEERRDRVKTKKIIDVETGYKERREFSFIMDLIQSDEIYFIYPDGISFRCYVKSDNPQYRHFMTEPTSIPLKVRSVFEEDFSTADIEFEKSDADIQVNPGTVNFPDGGGKQVITVTGNKGQPYEVINLPSWLRVSNQTLDSFELTADRNNTEDELSAQITVRLAGNPSVSATVSVSQEGAWLSEFIFDVVTGSANENVQRIVNLGAVESGQARFDYGDGTPVEVKTIPKSQDVVITNQQGGVIHLKVGTDFGHTFATSGTHTVTIKFRNGVDAFKFSSIPDGGTVFDFGAEYVPNPCIRTIRKIKSDSLEDASKMFAGCVRASFAADFPGLEMPNITNINYMFENFGSYGSGTDGAFTVNDRLRFPSDMYRFMTKKNQIKSITRTYFKSGFERIEKSMLSCSAKDTLTQVFETFRGMRNVGANWPAKYGNPDSSGKQIINYDDASVGYDLIIPDEFVETDIFWNQANICDFRGCFNAINDFYGAYNSGYSYKWLLKKDIFKGNSAPYLMLDAMFNKCTNGIMENGFFAEIAQKVRSMSLCFHAFQDGNPRVGGDMSIPGFNGADLNTMFPDASYPNMGLPVPGRDYPAYHMAGAFDFWPSDAGDNGNVVRGFQGLPFGVSSPYISNQLFNTDYTYWRYPENLRKNSFSIAAFLAKFPNVTASSGINPQDGATVIDGAAYNFGNYTQQDDSGNKKLTDIDTFAASNPARAQVVQKINLN